MSVVTYKWLNEDNKLIYDRTSRK